MTDIASRTWQEAVDPACLPFVVEQEKATAAMATAGAHLSRPETVNVTKLRRARLYHPDGSFRPYRSPLGRDGQVRAGGTDVPVRIFGNDQSDALLLHFHGGGWVLGSVYEQDALLEELSRRTGSTVVSIGYPLAPEHQLPEILEVAAAATAAVIDRHSACHMVAIVGESAGAQVAFQSLRAVRRDYPQIVAVALSYGIYDLSMTRSQRNWGAAFVGLSTDWLRWFYDQALPGLSPAERRAAAFSPLHADLRNLPSVLLGVGTEDPLLDDSVLLAAGLRAAGSDVTLRIYPAAPHGFNHLDTAMARHANMLTADFLNRKYDAARRGR